MSIILFDLLFAQPHNKVKYHGGGEYTKTIFHYLIENIQDISRLHILFDPEKYIDQEVKELIVEKMVNTHSVKNVEDIYNVMEQLSEHNQVLFFAGMVYPYVEKGFGENVYSIGVCHGLRMVEKPKDRFSILYVKGVKEFIREFLRMVIPTELLREYSKKKYLKALSKFNMIYTVSKHSRYSMKMYLFDNDYNIDINVHYQTLKYNSQRIQVYDEKYEREYAFNKYILMISADRWEKNSYRGIKAIDSLLSDGKMREYFVIVLGNYPNILRKKIKHKDKFVFKGYVNTNELEYAYRNCKLFFYPTLNEGYGLPPMEAMKYNKTCVLSAVCCLPEVYGDAAYYCNPYDIGEMKVRIIEALAEEKATSVIQQRIEFLEKMQNGSTKELLDILLREI